MWKPTVVLEKINRFFSAFHFFTLLFIHGSYCGQASLTLGKEPSKPYEGKELEEEYKKES